MTRQWQTIDAVDTPEGRLELRQRGAGVFLITVGGRVLMTSAAHTSEVRLGQLACAAIADRPAPRILIGGLGMAYTLRAVLDSASARARITVAELNETVVRWCRGPLAALTQHAVEDPRVDIRITDVAHVIERARGTFDAIILDLYEGPHAATQGPGDPLYGVEAIARTRTALAPRGVFAVWSEQQDPPFEERMRRAGFALRIERPGRGGRRHVAYLGSTPRSR